MSVEDAARVLEEKMRKQYGVAWDNLYQSTRRKLQEQTGSEEEQFALMLLFIGEASEVHDLILGCIWIARIPLSDPQVTEVREWIRKMPLRAFLASTSLICGGTPGL